MAEFAKYQDTTPKWDQKGCESLAAAIIRQAYEDYVYTRKRIEAIKSPSVSQNCMRMLERIMAEEVASRLGCGMRKAFKNLHLLRKSDIPFAERKAVGQAASIIHWFYSDSFQVLAGKVDPQYLVGKAEDEVQKWVRDGKSKAKGRGAMSKTKKEMVP